MFSFPPAAESGPPKHSVQFCSGDDDAQAANVSVIWAKGCKEAKVS